MPDRHKSPTHSVDRPQLRRQLDVGLAAPLALVVAPAGAGKTVLLSQWVASRPDLAVAWFDATAADNDSVHFARRIAQGLSANVPCLGEIEAPLGESAGGLGEATLGALTAAVADADTEVVMIFDDLHILSNRALVEDLWRLADRLPDNTHLVFSSRVDLRLAWSRHRLRHGLVELRGSQLAMSARETTAVLERITGKPVDESTAATIQSHTEGWAAGIQLAGLTLRFRGAETVVESLDETDQLIVDYLSEEVLEAQTPERRAALLRLSVLDAMCAQLVHELIDVDDAEGSLRDLVDESMFVTPLPGHRGWYRFHALFRDLLRNRLRATDAAAPARLLRIAADWYLAEGDPSAAIEHLLRAGLWEEAIDLIVQRGRSIYDQGQTATVARWLSMVPVEVRRRRPDTETLYGVAVGMTGRAAEAEDILRELLADPRTDVGHRIVVSGYLAALVQFLPHAELYLGDALRTIEMLDSQPDAELPDILQLTDRDLMTAVAAVSAGRAHLFLGELTPARKWMERGLVAIGKRYPPYRIHALGSVALAEAWVGNLQTAAEHAEEALDLARELALLTHPATADAFIARGVIAILRGEAEAGAISLNEGNLRAASNQRNQLMWIAHLASKLIDPLGTDAAAIEPSGTAPPVVKEGLLAVSHRAARLAGESRTPQNPRRVWSGLVFEDIASLITENQLGAARMYLEKVPFVADPLSPIPGIEHRLVRGWLFAREGRTAASREELAAALELAESAWLLHPFMCAGAQITPLIDALPGKPSRFRRAVVQKTGRVARRPVDGLIEPLTSREVEILTYMPTRLTNVEIAERCYVSVNTIKTHTAHIYRKLGVPGRTAAIVRARELGLIDAVDTISVL